MGSSLPWALGPLSWARYHSGGTQGGVENVCWQKPRGARLVHL